MFMWFYKLRYEMIFSTTMPVIHKLTAASWIIIYAFQRIQSKQPELNCAKMPTREPVTDAADVRFPRSGLNGFKGPANDFPKSVTQLTLKHRK